MRFLIRMSCCCALTAATFLADAFLASRIPAIAQGRATGVLFKQERLDEKAHVDLTYKTYRTIKKNKLGPGDFYFAFTVYPQFERDVTCRKPELWDVVFGGKKGALTVTLTASHVPTGQALYTNVPLLSLGAGQDPSTERNAPNCPFQIPVDALRHYEIRWDAQYNEGDPNNRFDISLLFQVNTNLDVQDGALIAGLQRAVGTYLAIFPAQPFLTPGLLSQETLGHVVDVENAIRAVYLGHAPEARPFHISLEEPTSVRLSLPKRFAGRATVKGDLVVYPRLRASVVAERLPKDRAITADDILNSIQLGTKRCLVNVSASSATVQPAPAAGGPGAAGAACGQPQTLYDAWHAVAGPMPPDNFFALAQIPAPTVARTATTVAPTVAPTATTVAPTATTVAPAGTGATGNNEFETAVRRVALTCKDIDRFISSPLQLDLSTIDQELVKWAMTRGRLRASDGLQSVLFDEEKSKKYAKVVTDSGNADDFRKLCWTVEQDQELRKFLKAMGMQLEPNQFGYPATATAVPAAKR
jgi:hypothetical protein